MKAAAVAQPPKKSRAAVKPSVDASLSIDEQVEWALAWLKKHSSRATLDGMARFAIPSDHALGVSMGNIQALAKQLGRNHDLAAALWGTGVYEARMLTAYVDEPASVTDAQMDRWCRDFDNWAICDTLCFALFYRTSHAWRKVEQWAGRRHEFVKRAAFVLLASLARQDKNASAEALARGLELIEREADDDRNFVRKGVSWALRSIGRRAAFKEAALTVAKRLAASPEPAARWVGKDAIRDLTKAARARKTS